LLVFDPTPCATLDLVVGAFKDAGGQEYLGPDAYEHIAETAGPARADFLRRYVAEPLERYEDTIPDFGAGRALADLRLSAVPDEIRIEVVGFEPYVVPREVAPETVIEELELFDAEDHDE
jgi:hypothetical protein